MSFRDDERGQSIQIGAVLLFGVLIISFATYQAYVVPNQNQKIEANHVDEIRQDMQDLRNTVVSVPGSGIGQSVTLSLGTTYPGRMVAVNPAPPVGTIRTVGTGNDSVNVTVANARATDGEVDDLWDGTNQSFNSGAMTFQPGYNEYRNPPRIEYENSVLFESFRDGDLASTSQTLVDGRRLRLVALNGSLDRSEPAVSLDVKAVSASSNRISVTNETGENVTIDVVSQRSAGMWQTLLRDDQQFHDQGGHVVSVTETDVASTPFRVVHLELEQGVSYTLQMAKVGVGTRTTSEGAAYVTAKEGDGETVAAGSTTELVVEVRDRFNNPVDGVQVNGSVDSGTLSQSSTETDADGLATFEYQAPSSSTTVNADFSYEVTPGASFDASTPENVSMTLQVTSSSGSSGTYTVSWLDPSGQSGVTCPDGPDGTCTVDRSTTSSVTLTMSTSPVAEEAAVDYAVNDTSIGTLSTYSGTTDASGQDSTDLSPTSNGGITVYTSSGGNGDTIVFEVITSVQDLLYNNDAVAVDGPDGDSVTGGVEFTVTNSMGQELNVTEVTVTEPAGPADSINDEVTPNDEPRRTEIYVSGDLSDGWVDLNGGTILPNTFDMDADGFNHGTEPQLSDGATSTFYLFEFENSGPGTRVDMTGRSFDVTIAYELADGTTGTKTFTVTPS